MPAECRNGHQLRGPMDFRPREGCIYCRRDRQRRYQRKRQMAYAVVQQMQDAMTAYSEMASERPCDGPVRHPKTIYPANM